MQEGSSSSGQPQSGQAQQQSESGQRRDSAEGPREQGQQPEQGQEPGEQPGEQQGPRQEPGEGEPRGDQADKPGGKKDTGDAAADGETGEGTRSGRDAEIWGNLPIHLRDIYRAEGREDMPAQYRDWIDSYYRRLNDSGRN
jgi:hypothetical protein